jgi:hypothetical protein
MALARAPHEGSSSLLRRDADSLRWRGECEHAVLIVALNEAELHAEDVGFSRQRQLDRGFGLPCPLQPELDRLLRPVGHRKGMQYSKPPRTDVRNSVGSKCTFHHASTAAPYTEGFRLQGRVSTATPTAPTDVEAQSHEWCVCCRRRGRGRARSLLAATSPAQCGKCHHTRQYSAHRHSTRIAGNVALFRHHPPKPRANACGVNHMVHGVVCHLVRAAAHAGGRRVLRPSR